MRGTKRITMWLKALLSRRAMESELDEEMHFHIEMEAAKHARRGISDAEARRRASLAFGSLEQHKETMREGQRPKHEEINGAAKRLVGGLTHGSLAIYDFDRR